MKTLKSSNEFVTGENNIAYIGSNFKERFGDMEFKKAEAAGILIKPLPRAMNDKEIIAELSPDPITLGDLLAFFTNGAEKSEWYVCHIKDKDSVLWAVNGYWRGSGWRFGADALDDPYDWDAGSQFLSRGFSVTKDLTLEHSDTLSLSDRIKAIEDTLAYHNLGRNI